MLLPHLASSSGRCYSEGGGKSTSLSGRRGKPGPNYDHVIRINESLDTLRELFTGALEANLPLVSTGQNEVTKKLAGAR